MVYQPVPALRPGAPVAVIAPSGHPPPEELARGVTTLGTRYDVRFYGPSRAPWGMCAGRDDERANELRWALSDPDIEAVWAARGGYGAIRVLDQADLGVLAERPRLIIGFSDITALLAGILAQAKIRTLHGPSVCQVGKAEGASSGIEALLPFLEGPLEAREVTGLTQVVAGRGAGPLVGGNLTVLTHLLGTPYFPNLAGAVLFLEDVGERPYRLDRCLTQLRLAGVLDGVHAVVLGDMTRCEPRGMELPCWTWLTEFFRDLGRPTVRGLAAGHGGTNTPLPLGAPVEVDGTEGRVTICEGAVAQC